MGEIGDKNCILFHANATVTHRRNQITSLAGPSWFELQVMQQLDTINKTRISWFELV